MTQFLFKGIVLPCLAIGVVGCGQQLDKVVVKGTVTFNGKKVLNGDIRFVPEAGGSGPATVAPIVDGSYEAVNRGGVPVGKHRIVLRAFAVEGLGSAMGDAKDVDILEGPAATKRAQTQAPVYLFEGRPQFLPPEYNKEPGLVVEVSGDVSPQVEDFNLRDSSS